MPTEVEEWHVEMFWDCTQCGHIGNRGKDKTCQGGCGHQLDKDEEFYLPKNVNDKVIDPELLRKATGGADWTCRFCKSQQFRVDRICEQCGSDQNESTPVSRFTIESLEEHENSIPPPKNDSGLNRDLLRKVAQRSESPAPTQETWKIPTWVWVAPIGLSLIGLLIWFLIPKEVDAKVVDVYFQHAVHVERYQEFHRTGWDPPGRAINVHIIDKRIHHHDQVPDGFREEVYYVTVTDTNNCHRTPRTCRQGTCTSKKNGFATCSKICSGGDKVCGTKKDRRTRQVQKYRDVPRYREWYSWDVWEWAHNRDVYATGHTTQTHWPPEEEVALHRNLSKGEDERVTKESSYTVKFEEDGDSWNYHPADLNEFQTFIMGALYHIRIQAGIVKVEYKK